jgi:hypothetical protein
MPSTLPFGLIVDPKNDELLARLRVLENYDCEHITRSVQSKYGWDPDRAKKVEIDTKKFFALGFLDQGHYHIPEDDVDEYWHRMILHTRFYIDFCDQIFGEYYHHMPEPDANALNEENRNRTLKLMPYWFGDTWKSVVKTCTQCRGPYVVSILQPASDVLPKF